MATHTVIITIIVIDNAVNITFILTYEQSQAISLNVCLMFHNSKNRKCLEFGDGLSKGECRLGGSGQREGR